MDDPSEVEAKIIKMLDRERGDSPRSLPEGSEKDIPETITFKHARYYWLLLAEGHLSRRLFGSMLRMIAALPLPDG